MPEAPIRAGANCCLHAPTNHIDGVDKSLGNNATGGCTNSTLPNPELTVTFHANELMEF
eukprot:CAMPEP_0172670692 /NCGR_PEP_ID=MMETSP1074-20121228/10455_1 /TAXON_ID=2916 /ORGANISM="Ceratium fusus, Strain PA161109" /LENGTH=58 /DNA_ID=CAMNT_0013487637 /DNA_START=267 /DNA_END=443 /DNA_ORIENTATION=-